MRWALVLQGAVVALAGVALAAGMNTQGWLGGSQSGFYLIAWLAILGGLWRSAVGLISR